MLTRVTNPIDYGAAIVTWHREANNLGCWTHIATTESVSLCVRMEKAALGLCGHIGKGVRVSGLKMRRNFLHRQLTGRSVAAENIHVVADVADRANRRVIPASAFATFGANLFTPFFMRKLLHNGNDALKGCTVASPPLPFFEIARVLVRFDHVASFIVSA